MEVDYTLSSMFESNKRELENKLKDLVLPKDANKVQEIVSKYLNEIFENEGKYRQSLTLAEDYILQAALSLLYAQQRITGEFINTKVESPSVSAKHLNVDLKHYNTHAIVGTTAGGTLGALVGGASTVLGTWISIFGAVAGTAIVLYCAFNSSTKLSGSKPIQSQVSQQAINVEAFLDIVKNICEKVDNLIETFRVQVQRIKNEYEQREKTSLMNTYSLLMTNLESLFQIVEFSNGDNTSKKEEAILMNIDLVKRSLKNYGIYYEEGKLINKSIAL